MKAKLYYRYGTMNSGKSMFLLATVHSFEERGIPFLIIKSSIDTRDDGVIKSRALGNKKCDIITPQTNIEEWVKNVLEKKIIKWIFVDESQFLTSKQVDELSNVVDYLNINVICYGLRTDFQTHLFEGSKRLFEIADTIEEIKSTCSCERKNIFNARIDTNGDVISEGSQIEIGAEDKYLSMCRKCYKEKLNNK